MDDPSSQNNLPAMSETKTSVNVSQPLHPDVAHSKKGAEIGCGVAQDGLKLYQKDTRSSTGLRNATTSMGTYHENMSHDVCAVDPRCLTSANPKLPSKTDLSTAYVSAVSLSCLFPSLPFCEPTPVYETSQKTATLRGGCSRAALRTTGVSSNNGVSYDAYCDASQTQFPNAFETRPKLLPAHSKCAPVSSHNARRFSCAQSHAATPPSKHYPQTHVTIYPRTQIPAQQQIPAFVGIPSNVTEGLPAMSAETTAFYHPAAASYFHQKSPPTFAPFTTTPAPVPSQSSTGPNVISVAPPSYLANVPRVAYPNAYRRAYPANLPQSHCHAKIGNTGSRVVRRKSDGPWTKMLCVKEMDALKQRAREQWILNKERWEAASPVCVPRDGELFDESDWVEADNGPLSSCWSGIPPAREREYVETPMFAHHHMPPRRRYVDELDITFRDLFPGLSQFFESCCCPEKTVETRRVVPRQQCYRGPRVETVCLECGHVLAQRPLLPRSVGDVESCYTMQDPDSLGEGQPKALCCPSEQMPTYTGYEGWDVHPRLLPVQREKKTPKPLPVFEPGHTRCFRNAPGAVELDHVRRMRGTELYEKDETGHTALPTFP